MPAFSLLTRDEALEMQQALISEYGKPEFQAKLRYVLKDACTAEDKKKIGQELREVREKVGARFGFEASPEGVKKSSEMFTPQLLADPEIASSCNVVNILLYPHLQDEVDKQKNTVMIPKKMIQFLKTRAEMAAKYDVEKALGKKAIIAEEVGRHWTVIGGKGALVREDEDLHSQEYTMRLAKDAIIEELALIGGRLHYKKLSGEGPDCGWVSILVKGTTLMRPIPKDILGGSPVPEVG